MNIVDGLQRVFHSPAFKFVLIIGLILALTIPLLMVALLVSERERNASRASSDVSRMWSEAQTVRGPYIVVPTTRIVDVRKKDGIEQQTVHELAVFLPENLDIVAETSTERRRRGIFEIPVYRSTLSFKGRFIPPIVRSFEQSGTQLHWEQASLALTLDDVRGIKKTAVLSFGDGSAPQKFRAGLEVPAARQTQGIHLPLSAAQAKGGFPFSFALELNGSRNLQFVPTGGETSVTIKSDWPHPSFTGAFLPDQSEISDAGFQASWKIPRLARGIGQTLKFTQLLPLMHTKSFGVDFYQPVRFYTLAERALKYALGFISIIFLAVFVMEIQSQKRVHWIQYLFVGFSLIVFYLVLIGTAEHIGFDLGYLAAAVATSLLVGTYVGMVVRSLLRGLSLVAILGVIYALLYLLLRIEDYALLIGSLAAFVLLATVMFATRNVDWSRGSRSMTDNEGA
ncbi:MAG: cell envelope integrity protein CreD [Pseudomonadota bacterium]